MLEEHAPTVSVIMPFRDTGTYIGGAIGSCLRQRVNLELLCVDDGSTDGSREVVETWQRRDRRVRLLEARQENRGPGQPRNVAIDAARGRYLAFLDSDDRFGHDMLPRLVRRAERQRLDVAMGSFDTFDSGGRHRAPCSYRSTFRGRRARRPFDFSDVGPELLGLRFSACNKIFRVDFVREHGLRFSEGVFYEDLNFTFPAMVLASRMGFERSALYMNRKGREDATTALRGDRVADAVGEYARFADFLRTHGVHELQAPFEAYRFRKLLGYLPRNDAEALPGFVAHLGLLAASLTPEQSALLRDREREAIERLRSGSLEELLAWYAWREQTRRKSAQRRLSTVRSGPRRAAMRLLGRHERW